MFHFGVDSYIWTERFLNKDLWIIPKAKELGFEVIDLAIGHPFEFPVQAVLEEKGEKRETARECAADLTVNANIPEKYVPSAQQRMDLYRRIASIRTNDDASDVLDELIDRYGEPPKPVLALLDVALLRAAAVKAGVGDISQRGDKLKLRLDVFHPAALSAVCAMPKYRRSLLLSGTDTPTLTLTLPKGADVLETALTLVEDLQLKAQSPA